MAKYKIEMDDGAIYEIDADDTTSEQDIYNYVLEHHTPKNDIESKVDTVEQPERTIIGTAQDVAVTAGKGLLGLAETGVGLADLASEGAAGKYLDDNGYNLKNDQEYLDSLYSPAQKAANKNVEGAEGFVDTASAMLENPSTIAKAAAESLPSMLVGGAVGRGLAATSKIAPYLAGAAGEAVVASGQQAEGIRQQTDDGYLTPKQSALAIASGIGTGVIGAAAGRVAIKFGLTDIDTLAAGGDIASSNTSILKRVLGGAISEGVLEEMPQSAQEKMLENIALDKDPFEGVGTASATGLLTGGLMGSAGGLLHKGDNSGDSDLESAVKKNLDAAKEYNANRKANGEGSITQDGTSPLGEEIKADETPRDNLGDINSIIRSNIDNLATDIEHQKEVTAVIGDEITNAESVDDAIKKSDAVVDLTLQDATIHNAGTQAEQDIEKLAQEQQERLLNFGVKQDELNKQAQTEADHIAATDAIDNVLNDGGTVISDVLVDAQGNKNRLTKERIKYAREKLKQLEKSRSEVAPNETIENETQERRSQNQINDVLNQATSQSEAITNELNQTDGNSNDGGVTPLQQTASDTLATDAAAGEEGVLSETLEKYKNKITQNKLPSNVSDNAINELDDANDINGNPTGWKKLYGNNEGFVSIINPVTRDVITYNSDKGSGADYSRANIVVGSIAQEIPVSKPNNDLPQNEFEVKPVFNSDKQNQFTPTHQLPSGELVALKQDDEGNNYFAEQDGSEWDYDDNAELLPNKNEVSTNQNEAQVTDAVPVPETTQQGVQGQTPLKTYATEKSALTGIKTNKAFSEDTHEVIKIEGDKPFAIVEKKKSYLDIQEQVLKDLGISDEEFETNDDAFEKVANEVARRQGRGATPVELASGEQSSSQAKVEAQESNAPQVSTESEPVTQGVVGNTNQDKKAPTESGGLKVGDEFILDDSKYKIESFNNGGTLVNYSLVGVLNKNTNEWVDTTGMKPVVVRTEEANRRFANAIKQQNTPVDTHLNEPSGVYSDAPILKKDGTPFQTKAAANIVINGKSRTDLSSDTHEAVELPTGGFGIVAKAPTTSTEKSVEDSTDNLASNVPDYQIAKFGMKREQIEAKVIEAKKVIAAIKKANLPPDRLQKPTENLAKWEHDLGVFDKLASINSTQENQQPTAQASSDNVEVSRGTQYEPEKHYSEIILDTLVDKYGWKRSEAKGVIEKDVGGNTTEGTLNTKGTRIITASFDTERSRYLTAYSGFDEIVQVDGRGDVADRAKEFNYKVNTWARKNAASDTVKQPASTRELDKKIDDYLTQKGIQNGTHKRITKDNLVRIYKDAPSEIVDRLTALIVEDREYMQPHIERALKLINEFNETHKTAAPIRQSYFTQAAANIKSALKDLKNASQKGKPTTAKRESLERLEYDRDLNLMIYDYQQAEVSKNTVSAAEKNGLLTSQHSDEFNEAYRKGLVAKLRENEAGDYSIDVENEINDALYDFDGEGILHQKFMPAETKQVDDNVSKVDEKIDNYLLQVLKRADTDGLKALSTSDIDNLIYSKLATAHRTDSFGKQKRDLSEFELTQKGREALRDFKAKEAAEFEKNYRKERRITNEDARTIETLIYRHQPDSSKSKRVNDFNKIRELLIAESVKDDPRSDDDVVAEFYGASKKKDAEKESTAPEPKSDLPQSEKDDIDSQLDDVLGEIGMGIMQRLSMKVMPEQQVSIAPLIAKAMILLGKKGYIQFKDSAVEVIKLVRGKFGDKIADAIDIEDLQGGYIGARKYIEGADDYSKVGEFKAIDDLFKVDTIEPKPTANTETNKADSTVGNTVTIATPSNEIEFEAQYEVAEIGDVVASHDMNNNINPSFSDKRLQARKRDDIDYEVKTQDQIKNFNPKFLGASAASDDGAPIITNSTSKVISGNGRHILLSRLYSRFPDKAAQYKQWLIDNAKQFGLSPDAIAKMDKPILVRRKSNDDDLELIADKSNVSGMAEMSALDRAFSDARQVSESVFLQFKGGELESFANQPFVQAFNDALNLGGSLTLTSLNRMKNAIMAHAYGDYGSAKGRAIVEGISEELKPDAKSILNALYDSSSEWVLLRAAFVATDTKDFTNHLVDAVHLIRDARANGKEVKDMVDQYDMETMSSTDPFTRQFVQLFFKDANMKTMIAQKDIASILKDVATEMTKQISNRDMFDDVKPLTPKQILENAYARYKGTKSQPKGQVGIFDAGFSPFATRGDKQREAESRKAESGQGTDSTGVKDEGREVDEIEQLEKTIRHYEGIIRHGINKKAIKQFSEKVEVLKRELSDKIKNKGNTNVPSTNTDLERNSGIANSANERNETPVFDGTTGDADLLGQSSEPVKSAENVANSDKLDSISIALTGGESSDNQLLDGNETDVIASSDARDSDSGRSGQDSLNGMDAKRDGSNPIKELPAKSVKGLKPKQVTHVEADLENVKEAMPFLNEGQAADVVFAEKRFEEHKGVLFANGTGTGKTFSGLGIVSRFANQGKNNILIVAPSQNILDSWTKAAKNFFGLDVSLLEDKNDAGKGIVATTYANFGDNVALVNREWDLIVTDEAHYLMSNSAGTNTASLEKLRGLTGHEQGFENWFSAKYSDLVAEFKKVNDRNYLSGISDNVYYQERGEKEQHQKEVSIEYKDTREAAREEWKTKESKTKTVMLSATPFAYESNIDYANGYLFDYDKVDGSGYNAGGGKERFFMQHLGYRMRYNKLTQPDAKVDRSTMQRQFNEMLKKTGALSARTLDVDYDYDRQFILTESAIGQRIDEALQWLSDNQASELAAEINETFDYLTRRYLLEAIKAKEIIPVVKEHLAAGRKVLVFHDYKKGGATNPFSIKSSDEKVNKQYQDFKRAFPDLTSGSALEGMQLSPIEHFENEFGKDVLIYNGDVSSKERIARVAQFNDDNSGKNLILLQSASAKEGVSFHDTTGVHQRVLINIGLPTAPTTAIQQEGRIYRVGQKSDAIFRYVNTGTNWERWAFASTIAGRASAAENLALGEGARGLRDAFINAFENSDSYPVGHEGEGKGGKDSDKQAYRQITEMDRAKGFYYATQKKNSRTKSAEGTDYYATPEPVGLVMTRLADAREGEKMLEPSAGHGAIARWFRTDAERTAIEPSSELNSRLALVFQDGDIKRQTFEDLNIVNKYDAIVMNPPFGTGGKTAIEHLEKAFNHLRDGGRVVALIPEGAMADKRLDAFLNAANADVKPIAKTSSGDDIYVGDKITSFAWVGKGRSQKYTEIAVTVVSANNAKDGSLVNIMGTTKDGTETIIDWSDIRGVKPTGERPNTSNKQLVADISLPTVTFERAGTKVKTHIVVIEKTSSNITTENVDLSGIDDINQLFDRLDALSIDERVKPVEEVAEKESTPVASNTTETVGTLVEGKHTKTGEAIFTVQLPARVERDTYTKWAAAAKQMGGGWSRFTNGFLFKTKDAADKFMDYLSGGSEIKYSYAGQRAQNADQSALARAVQMEQDGVDNETIRKETGWFLGMDDKWRFEISDDEVKTKAPFAENSAREFGDIYKDNKNSFDNVITIGDILDAPNLFAAYPEFESMRVYPDMVDPHTSSFSAVSKIVRIGSKKLMGEAKSDLLHEIQHAIQRIEGFARGGSQEEFKPSQQQRDDINALSWRKEIEQFAEEKGEKVYGFETDEEFELNYNLLSKELINRYIADDMEEILLSPDIIERSKKDWFDKGSSYRKKLEAEADIFLRTTGSPFDKYQRLAGEIEARDTQSRMNLTDAQRKDSTPYVSQGISKEDAIVRFGDGVANSEAAPIDTHSKQSFMSTAKSALDAKFGKGWFDRLWGTNSFEAISDAEALRIVGGDAKFAKAYHASPFDFESFDFSKNREGQGDEAFGYGIYVAGDKGIAKTYKGMIGAIRIKDRTRFGKPYSTPDAFFTMAEYDNLSDAIPELEQYIKDGESGKKDYRQSTIDETKDVLAKLKKGDYYLDEKVNTYEVEIPDESEFLQWDKSLNKQSEYVQSILTAAGFELTSKKGSSLYKSMAKQTGNNKKASEYLAKLGIAGVKVIDDLEGNSFNYTVFNPTKITIEAKYSKDGKIEAFYNPADDKAYFVPENISKDTDLAYLFAHEIGVHMMQMGENQAGFDAILREVETLVKTGNEHAVKGRKDAENAGTKAEHLTEETLAYMIKHAPKLSVVQKFIAWFRKGLRYYGLTRFKGEAKTRWLSWETKLTSDDVSYMAYATLKRAPSEVVFKGDPNGDGVKFSGDNKPLLAPNGKPSNLNAMQHAQVRTPEFKAWFGDWENDPKNASKVVDENGEPLVVYHGTSYIEEDGDTFSEFYDGATHFTDVADVAYAFAGNYDSYLIPVFLDIKNPQIIKNKQAQNFINDGNQDDIIEKAYERGRDGLIVKSVIDMIDVKSNHYVVFDNQKIKSATGNNGNFDAGNNDIRFSKSVTPSNGGNTENQLDFTVPAMTGLNKAQAGVQDDLLRIKQTVEAVKKAGGKVTANNNPYIAAELAPNVAAAHIEDFHNAYVKPLQKRMAELNVDSNEVGLLAYAKHAPEANEYIATINKRFPDGGSGMTNAESAELIEKYQEKFGADYAKVEKLADDWQKVTKMTQRILVESGDVSQETADEWNGKYDYYIPLKGFEDEIDTDKYPSQNTGGKGFTTSSGFAKRRLGRESRAGQILENIVRDAERSIIRASNIYVTRTLRDFMVDNPNKEHWEVNVQPIHSVMGKSKKQYHLMYRGEEVAVRDTFKDVQRFKKYEIEQAGTNKDDYEIEETGGEPQVKSMIKPFDEHAEIAFYENGKRVRLKVNDDDFIVAFNRLGDEKIFDAFRTLIQANRFFREVYINFNPNFLLNNAQRDVQTSFVINTARRGVPFAVQAIKNLAGATRALWQVERAGSAKNNEWNKLIKDYRLAGGSIGRSNVSGLEAVVSDFEKAIERAKKYSYLDETKGIVKNSFANPFVKENHAKQINALQRMWWHTTDNKFFDLVEQANKVIEQSARLATFKTAIDKGESAIEAAHLSNNTTVHFGRRGSYGREIGAHTLFFNANVQGTQNLFNALSEGKNKKQAWGLIAGYMAIGFALELLNNGGDDDDDDLIRKGDKERNFVWQISKEFAVFAALPFGIAFFVDAGRGAAKLIKSNSAKEAGNAIRDVGYSFAHNFLPINLFPANELNLQDAIIASMPQVAKGAAYVAFNRNAFGSPVMPETYGNDYIPDSEREFERTKGKPYSDFAHFLNRVTGGDMTEKGAIDISPESLKAAVQFTTGGAGSFIANTISLGYQAATAPGFVQLKDSPIKTPLRQIGIDEYRSRYYDQKMLLMIFTSA
jgi:hypothetical protein